MLAGPGHIHRRWNKILRVLIITIVLNITRILIKIVIVILIVMVIVILSFSGDAVGTCLLYGLGTAYRHKTLTNFIIQETKTLEALQLPRNQDCSPRSSGGSWFLVPALQKFKKLTFRIFRACKHKLPGNKTLIDSPFHVLSIYVHFYIYTENAAGTYNQLRNTQLRSIAIRAQSHTTNRFPQRPLL